MEMQHLAYKQNVLITGLPHPLTVLCLTDYTVYGVDLCWPGHTGVDAYKAGTNVPLYAISDGVVLEVSTAADPNHTYVRYEYAGIAPAVRTKNGLTWAVEHMQECFVEAGDYVVKGQAIGYQGYTGNVIPAGVGGTHSHTKFFDQFNTLIDPIPYITSQILIPGYGFKQNPPVRLHGNGFSPVRKIVRHR